MFRFDPEFYFKNGFILFCLERRQENESFRSWKNVGFTLPVSAYNERCLQEAVCHIPGWGEVAGSWDKLYDGDARWEGQLLPAHLGGAHHNTLLFLLDQGPKSAFLKNLPGKVLGGRCLSVWGPRSPPPPPCYTLYEALKLILNNHSWRKILKRCSISLFIFCDLVPWLIGKLSELYWTFTMKKIEIIKENQNSIL